MKTNKIALLGMGTALYVVLGFVAKIPLISHIQMDFGYVAFGYFLYVLGWPAYIVGVAGCMIESLIFSGWIPIGWMLGQLFIGVVCGIIYKKTNITFIHVYTTIFSVCIGISIIKTVVECILFNISFVVKFPKNFIAFVADVIPMLLGYFIAKRVSIWQVEKNE